MDGGETSDVQERETKCAIVGGRGIPTLKAIHSVNPRREDGIVGETPKGLKEGGFVRGSGAINDFKGQNAAMQPAILLGMVQGEIQKECMGADDQVQVVIGDGATRSVGEQEASGNAL